MSEAKDSFEILADELARMGQQIAHLQRTSLNKTEAEALNQQLGVCCRTGLNPTLSPFRPSVFPREQDVGPSEGRDVSQEAG